MWVGSKPYVPAQVSQFKHYWHLVPDNSLSWGCPAHCCMFSTIPDLHHPLDASSPSPQSWQPQLSPDIATCSLEEWNCPQLRTTVLKEDGILAVYSNWQLSGIKSASLETGRFHCFLGIVSILELTWRQHCFSFFGTQGQKTTSRKFLSCISHVLPQWADF